MKLISWNCRGLGQALTVRTAKNLARQHGANLIFLMETKCCVEKLKGMGLSLGFKFSYGVDPIGYSGGLWAAWDDKYKVVPMYKCANFLVLLVEDERGVKWALCLVYGHPRLNERKWVWDFLSGYLEQLNMPMLVVGDYNQILTMGEKLSANLRSPGGIEWLQDFSRGLGLSEVRSFGVFYTWTNNREGDEATYERLDRAMANRDWKAHFPNAAVLTLPIQRSDHSPLVVDLYWSDKPGHRPKRFEEIWLRAEGVRQIINRVWNLSFSGSNGYQLVQKQNVLMRHLRNWKDFSYHSLTRRMNDIRERLKTIQGELAGQGQQLGVQQSEDYESRNLGAPFRMGSLVKEDRLLRAEFDQLVEVEEIFWEQRAKQRWLNLGDRNSSQERRLLRLYPFNSRLMGRVWHSARELWRSLSKQSSCW